MREEGFYKVVVKEFGPPFETIGLWCTYGNKDGSGYWHFAEGDGREMGTCFNVISIDETMIMKDRVYKEDNGNTTK